MLPRFPVLVSLCLLAIGGVSPTTASADGLTLPPQEILVPPAPASELPETAQPQNSPAVTGGEWVVQIRPGRGNASATLSEKPSYEELYQAIPYRRAEYLANPSYRHEAALEMYFGKMRSTVVHRTDSAQRIVNPRPEPYRPYLMSSGELSTFWSQRPFWGWNQPQLSPWVLP